MSLELPSYGFGKHLHQALHHVGNVSDSRASQCF
jgi:hypothetical protein